MDSNVVLYAFDRNEPKKREIARALFASLPPRTFVISTQVLQEFSNVALRKNWGNPDAVREMLDIRLMFRVETITVPVIYEAVELVKFAQLSFWDAVIISTARAAGCNVLVTEDLNTGQVIEGIRIYNPFSKGSRHEKPEPHPKH